MPVHLKYTMIKSISMMISILFIIQLGSCQTKHNKKHKKSEEQEQANPLPALQKTTETITSEGCDSNLWKYVYNGERLEIITKCKTATGVIEESNADDDGDQHMLLKLDNGQEDLLTKRNIKKKQGDLVIEAVCVNKVNLKKVGTTCDGYFNKIQIPVLGQHVKVTGSLVLDSHNGWNEIHPITKIEIIK